ncbi:hypothetical protein BGZ73_000828 [Actinomortierella ambigua]|nr:hypothetical protein BGZ73_000828 [Actinomortierella ambigua]
MSDATRQQPDQPAHGTSHAASGHSNATAQSSSQNSDGHSSHSNQLSEGEQYNDIDNDDDDDDEDETFETDEGEVFEEDTDDDPASHADMQDALEGEGEDDEDDNMEELVLVVDEQTGLRRAASLSRSDPRHPESAATAAAVARSSSPMARRLLRQHVRMTTPRTNNTSAGVRGRPATVSQGSALQESSSSSVFASSSSSSSAGPLSTTAESQSGQQGGSQGTGSSSSSAAAASSSATTAGATTTTTTTTTTTSTTTRSSAPVVDEKAQSELRRKIMDIQRDPTISFADKAAMIQRLMSLKWQESKKQEIGKDEETQDGSSNASAADLKTTYNNEEEKIMGCKHYSRGCKLKANCCGKWFNCRFCHDDACDHAIVRTDTKFMLCMHCKSIQPAAQNCKDCHKQMARYYCNVCKLWDDDPKKSIYHCDDCGICRIGRGLGEDYFHCKKCNVCMAIVLQNNHKCIERNLECDCPICGEYMFTSTSTVIFMPCGHCIHSKCHDAYIRTSYQCPTCWKALADMSEYYAKVDQLMEQQQMPPEYASYYSIVLCNDCEVKTETAFHFLYHKCGQCKGYNTKVLQTFQRVANGQDKVVENAGEGASSGLESSQQNNSQRGIGGGNSMEGVDGGGNSAGPASIDQVGAAVTPGSSSVAAGSSSVAGSSSSTARLPPGTLRAASPGSLETSNDGGESLSGHRG